MTPGVVARPVLLLAAWLVALALAQLAAAGPAAAHAELVDSTPGNGARLLSAPTDVTLTFTESVRLVDGGLRLLDGDGETVPTAAPVAEGSTVRWPMPVDLADGAYLVSWRVVSADSHPIAGAFSFGVGVAPETVDAAPEAAPAPWQVDAARLGGYTGFALVAGAVALACLCWPAARGLRRVQVVLRAGLLLAAVSTVLALLLQGPYASGRPLSDLLDTDLLAETAATSYGAWTQLRLSLLAAMAIVVWPVGALGSRRTRWLTGAAVVATAVTFSGTGHAASGGVLERAMDSLHVLFAGLWVGGLLTLAVAALAPSVRPDRAALTGFSRLALLSVLAIVATGTLNAVVRIPSVEALWRSDYGRLLSLKVALVGVALAGAAVSRSRLHRGDQPWRSVRLEAATTVAVLAVTAVLASTSPAGTAAASAGPPGGASATSASVTMALGEGRSAVLRIDGLHTGGSFLRLRLVDAQGVRVDATAAELQATLPARDLGPLEVALTEDRRGWRGRYAFPLPGTWTLTLTVEDGRRAAVVTAGEVRIL